MKIIEVLNFNRELIGKLKKTGIRLDDAEYIDLYSDYERMIAGGDKVTYTVAVLAGRYGICERKVYSLVKKFGSECEV